jgi:hypothetical protein
VEDKNKKRKAKEACKKLKRKDCGKKGNVGEFATTDPYKKEMMPLEGSNL